MWIESPDPEKAIAVSAEDPSGFAAWFRERVMEINGIDHTAAPPSPPPTVTLDWSAES